MTKAAEKSLLALAYCLVATSLLFPVWYVDFVPMPDFPGHMSRIYALSVLDTNTTLAEMYEAEWDYLPNIGVDVFVLAAMKFVSLIAAGKLYISASVLLWMAGTAWLNRVLSGQWLIVPLFAAPFVLNTCFFLGFLNFMAASGLAIVGLAAWASMASWNPLTRLIFILPLTIVTYFTHIVGFFILASCMLGFELGRELAEPRILWQRGFRRLLLAAAALLPVVAIFIFLSPHEGHDGGWVFGDITRFYTRIGYAAYLTYGQPYYIALAFILLAGGVGLVTRKIAIDRRMWPILIGLSVAAVIAPVRMIGAAFVEIRLPPIIGALGIGSLWEHAGRLPKLVFGCILAGLLIYRAVIITETWTAYDRDYNEMAAAADKIEPGSKVFVAQVTPKSASGYGALMIYSHYLDLIGVQRNIFSPLIFAWPAQHPLRATQSYRSLSASSANQGILPSDHDLEALASGRTGKVSDRLPYLVRWQCKFDYLVNLHVDEGRNPATALLETQQNGKFFTIYKIIADRKDCR